jgi:DNA-binding transcriptional regulator YiaG
MTDKKPAQNPDFAPALAALIERHQLTETRAAGLLGVPVFTLRKWRTGTRAPSAAAVRLVEVLDMVGALAPALLAGLIPDAPPPRTRKPSGQKSPL